MENADSGILAIEIDAGDFAETVAGDAPSVSRTFQSEEAFRAEKASYTAKINGETGNNYQNLLRAVPALDHNLPQNGESSGEVKTKTKLSKRDAQLLGYAVGEMYYDREFERLVEVCERAKEVCGMDAKASESLERWIGRARERMLMTEDRGKFLLGHELASTSTTRTGFGLPEAFPDGQ